MQRGFRRAMRALTREIKARRLLQERSQEDLAHVAGLSVRHYQEIEGGTSANMQLATLFGIASALGTSPADLLEPGRRTRVARKRAPKGKQA